MKTEAPATNSPEVRVLMLGWEYPPRYAGGLGKACQGLSQALARTGIKIRFVLPSFPERVQQTNLQVVGAEEWAHDEGVSPRNEKVRYTEKTEIQTERTDAVLFPYGKPPQGPLPRSVVKAFWALEEDAPSSPSVSQAPPQPSTEGIVKGKASKEIYGQNLWSEIDRFSRTVEALGEPGVVDCVHAHDWMTFPAAFLFQERTGVPVFLHVHATEYDRAGEHAHSEVFRIEREAFKKADRIFAVSRYTAQVIERLYGIDPAKIEVVYNAPEEETKKLIADPDAKREHQAVFLGRLTFQKGPDHFLKACALVAQRDPKARFLFCGTGDMLSELRRMAFDLKIGEQVHFAGFLNPSSVNKILRQSKVLVMPSVSEPFGLVALEAIHCGLPAILSKQSGVREVIPRALQVDFWDHAKLADQIFAALRLPDLSRQLVNEGMEQIRALSWDKSAQTVSRAYFEVLGSRVASIPRGLRTELKSRFSKRRSANGH